LEGGSQKYKKAGEEILPSFPLAKMQTENVLFYNFSTQKQDPKLLLKMRTIF